jgi:serine O-acetyltransferase
MPEVIKMDGCKPEEQTVTRLSEEIPPIVSQLVESCRTEGCFSHVSPVAIPSREEVVNIIFLIRRILFPGYFHANRIDSVNLSYQLGQEVTELFQVLATQIIWAMRHDCYRYEQSCSQCEDRGHLAALEFLSALPELRRVLATDVRAAHEADPASGSFDEIIFSYPGLFAIAVYRSAHKLYELGVHLIPRIMTEYAHSHTGIDIHPGAEIGENFFIDHGTGVVVGQTACIGNRVRLYQGVTLGALSLPRDAGMSLRGARRHPTLEDDVIVYAGATILGGDTVVGARSVVGGNVWLTESVPPDTKVFLKAPELIYVGGRK